MAPFKKVLLYFLIVISGLLLGFAAIETSLRIFFPQPTGQNQFSYDSQLGYIPQPNQRGHRSLPGVFYYSFSHDEDGLRVTPGYSNVGVSGFRVLFLGDSFIYGWGVNDEETLPARVQQGLSNKGESVKVINSGNPAIGTDYELKFFRLYGKKMKPSVTVLGFCFNDYEDNFSQVYYRIGENGELHLRPLSDALVKTHGFGVIARSALFRNFPLYNWLISWSHTANLFKHAVGGIPSWFHRQSVPSIGLQSSVSLESVKITQIFLTKLIEEIENSGSKWLILYIPSAEEVTAYKKTHKISEKEATLKKILKNHQDLFLSSTLILANASHPISQLYYDSKRDGHWTPLAVTLVSDRLIPLIQKMGRN